MNILKTKAPVVAVPVEGQHPLCVEGERLRAWAKGVRILRVEVVTVGGEWYPVEHLACRFASGVERERVEGPANLVAEQTPMVRSLRITGRGKGADCTCKLVEMPRKDALPVVRDWAPKERERIAKSRMLGSLTPADKRALRRAKYEDDGEGMIPVHCAMASQPGKVEKRGIPVAVPEFGDLSFALVRWGGGDYETLSFTVTELVTGMQVGSGASGELAILDARTKAAAFTPRKMDAIRRKVASEFEAALADCVK